MSILGDALSAVGSFPFDWYQSNGRTQNAEGAWSASYADAVAVRGQVQPASIETINTYGIERGQIAYTVWFSYPSKGIQRDVSPDYFVWNGRKLTPLQGRPWFPLHGFVRLVAIDQGAA